MNLKQIQLNLYKVPGPNNPWKFPEENSRQIALNGFLLIELINIRKYTTTPISPNNKQETDADSKFTFYGTRLILTKPKTNKITKSFPPPRIKGLQDYMKTLTGGAS
jgi:hypothetical protein